MSRMFTPPHPGEVLKDGVMVEGVTVNVKHGAAW